jgi:glutamine amidotransferase
VCELLGLSFDRPVSARFSIEPFSSRATENADGWGLGWYSDGSLSLVKEPVSWRSSSFASFLGTYEALRSKTYIAHVRKRTVGREPNHADTHPFARETLGRSYCFAHNGTLRGFERLELGHHRPMGTTDSEHVFCHLLHRLQVRGGMLQTEDDWTWLARSLLELNDLGTLNCLLSDGARLFAYHCNQGYKGLWMRHLTLRDGEPRQMGDRETEVAVEGVEVTEGTVVATRPLDDTGWHSFQPGELLVLEAGRLCHSNRRASGKVKSR